MDTALPGGRAREVGRRNPSHSGQAELGETHSQFNVSFMLNIKLWVAVKRSNNFLCFWLADQSHVLPLPVTPPIKHCCWLAHFPHLRLNSQIPVPLNLDGMSEICDSFATLSVLPSLSVLLLICFTKSSPVLCSLSHASAKTNQVWPTSHFPPPHSPLSLPPYGLTCEAPTYMSSCASQVGVVLHHKEK